MDLYTVDHITGFSQVRNSCKATHYHSPVIKYGNTKKIIKLETFFVNPYSYHK